MRYLLVVGHDWNGGLRIFDALTGECVKDLTSPKFIPIRNYTGISLSSDGKRLVLPGDNLHGHGTGFAEYAETVSVINVESGEILEISGGDRETTPAFARQSSIAA